MKMIPTDIGLALPASFEGLRLDVYKDAAGIATIGRGHVVRDWESFPDGITERQADYLYARDLGEACDCVNEMVKVPLQAYQFDALVSFVFNIGRSAFGVSTCLKRLNTRRFDDVPFEMRRWVYAGGRRLAGLVRRRDREAALFSEEAHNLAVEAFLDADEPCDAHLSSVAPDETP